MSEKTLHQQLADQYKISAKQLDALFPSYAAIANKVDGQQKQIDALAAWIAPKKTEKEEVARWYTVADETVVACFCGNAHRWCGTKSHWQDTTTPEGSSLWFPISADKALMLLRGWREPAWPEAWMMPHIAKQAKKLRWYTAGGRSIVICFHGSKVSWCGAATPWTSTVASESDVGWVPLSEQEAISLMRGWDSPKSPEEWMKPYLESQEEQPRWYYDSDQHMVACFYGGKHRWCSLSVGWSDTTSAEGSAWMNPSSARVVLAAMRSWDRPKEPEAWMIPLILKEVPGYRCEQLSKFMTDALQAAFKPYVAEALLANTIPAVVKMLTAVVRDCEDALLKGTGS